MAWHFYRVWIELYKMTGGLHCRIFFNFENEREKWWENWNLCYEYLSKNKIIRFKLIEFILTQIYEFCVYYDISGHLFLRVAISDSRFKIF